MSGLLFGRVFKTRIPAMKIDSKAKATPKGKAKSRTIQGSTQKLVLLQFADKANDLGEGIYPSRKTIARETELSESAVSFAIDALEKNGLVTRLGLSRFGTGDYSICVDALAEIKRKNTPVLTEDRVSSVRTPPVLTEDTPLSSLRTPPVLSEDYNPQLTPQLNPPPTLSKPAAAAVGSWGDVFSASKLSKKVKTQLSDCDPLRYVAAYLYATTQGRINNPVALAAQLTIDGGKRIGRPFDDLAQLAPGQLAEVLAWVRDGCDHSLNGTMAVGLAYRGLLPAQKNHVAIATLALNDLGLDTLAAEPHDEAAELAELVAESHAPKPMPVENRWLKIVDALPVCRETKQNLKTSTTLVADHGHGLRVRISKYLMAWIERQGIRRELDTHHIEWELE